MNRAADSRTGPQRWMTRAACADRLDLPWTTDTADQATGAAEEMAAVCAGCPVVRSCTAYVAAAGVRGGTWAGIDRALPAQRAFEGLDLPLGGAA